MKKILSFLLFLSITLFISCRDASTKADHTDTLKKNTPDSVAKTDRITDNNIASAPAATDSNIIKNPAVTDILANIDKHLVSKPVYPAPGLKGGIVNGTVTVTNTLTNASFQKALIEVSILLADGKEYRTDYYLVINLEPGMTKTVKIPNTTQGSSVVSHIVKVKSPELTNSEYILTGNHYVPNDGPAGNDTGRAFPG